MSTVVGHSTLGHSALGRWGYASRSRQTPQRAARLRITARGRAVLLTLVATPLVIAALVIGINAGGATATNSATPLKTVSVTSGESLWQLAVALAPNADPRDVIADIMTVNQLTSPDIQSGQRLEIPAQYEH
jgi:hypothetical protein